MPEKVKPRESSSEPVLVAVKELRECLTSILEEERRRLRLISRDEPTSTSDRAAASSVPSALTDRPVSASSIRVVAVFDREPQLVGQAAPEVRPSLSSNLDGKLEGAASRSCEHESSRPENPRKRLDELAKMLDKRLKLAAEAMAKGSEAKASEAKEAER